MKITIDHHCDVPVYRQMVNALITAIQTRQIAIGDKLPSIRELSSMLGVNPNTTAKVYRELELRGFVESRAGSGSFVRPLDEKADAAEKKARMQQLVDKMLGEARESRIKEHELLQFLRLKGRT